MRGKGEKKDGFTAASRAVKLMPERLAEMEEQNLPVSHRLNILRGATLVCPTSLAMVA